MEKVVEIRPLVAAGEEEMAQKKPLNKRTSMERLTTTILKMKEFHHLATEQEMEEGGSGKENSAEEKKKKERKEEKGVEKDKDYEDGLDRLEVLMKTDRR